ncbi:MAG: hypothetical protein WC485_00330 [Opitutaceae bacterium]
MKPRDENKYVIANQFSAGFISGILASCHDTTDETTHWLAGWDAGYAMRAEKNWRLNGYLVSIGEKPMGVIRLQ